MHREIGDLLVGEAVLLLQGRDDIAVELRRLRLEADVQPGDGLDGRPLAVDDVGPIEQRLRGRERLGALHLLGVQAHCCPKAQEDIDVGIGRIHLLRDRLAPRLAHVLVRHVA